MRKLGTLQRLLRVQMIAKQPRLLFTEVASTDVHWDPRNLVIVIYFL
uniref:Uncharacterized protein n=1 Tax=Tetraselmis sp. GSL018 TaxID=582737 RepID=A0A061RJD5_9CHLO